MYKRQILNYGGIIQSLKIANREGKLIDVVLGYDDVASYERNSGYLGALIGRFEMCIRDRDMLGLYDATAEDIMLILDTAVGMKKLLTQNLKKLPHLQGRKMCIRDRLEAIPIRSP